MHAANKAVRVERYLKYLDKEMTIMGILSGFCVTVLALWHQALVWNGQSPGGSCRSRRLHFTGAGRAHAALGSTRVLSAAITASLVFWSVVAAGVGI